MVRGFIFNRKKVGEFERRLNLLLNLLLEKEVVVPFEMKELFDGLPAGKIDFAIKKMIYLGHSYQDGMLIFNGESRPLKEIVEKEILSFLIRPEFIDTRKKNIQISNQFYSTMFAQGFPASVEKNWLGKLSKEKGNVDFSIHLIPSSINSLELYLNNQLKQVENDLFSYQKKGLNNPSLENRKLELLEQLNSIIRGDYKLYRMSLYLANKGSTSKECLSLKDKTKSVLNSEGIEYEEGEFSQESIMRSVIPTAQDYLPSSQIMVPGPAVAASFPFSSSFFEPDLDGILLGFNANNIPVVKSLWKLEKYIGTVLGSTGSGKSYASKAFILNENLVNQTKTFVLDPEREYVDMAKNIKGAKIISLDQNSTSIPNIFDLMGSNFTDKIASLPKIFEVLLEGVNDIQKPILEEAIVETYRRKAIYEDKPKSWNKVPPRLNDLEKVLEIKRKTIKDDRISYELDVMISKLGRYTKGIFKFINNSKGTLDVDSDFIVFEFKEMTEEIRPIMMLILLEFIKTKFNTGTEKKLLVLDEAWRVLKSRQEAEYIEGFARTFRKRNGAMLLITQSVDELKGSPEGKAFLANTSFRYILKTENIILDETCELFGLNKNEREILANAKRGEGVLVWGNLHTKISVEVDPILHKIITTNPNEK